MNKLQIWNAALGKLGGGFERDMIASETDTNKDARWCSHYWDAARRKVLGEWEWIEATKYGGCSTALSGSSLPAWYDGDDGDTWDYIFELPSDCVRFLKQTNQGSNDQTLACERVGKYLLTNSLSDAEETTAYIKYIYDNQDVQSLPEDIANAIAAWLAYLICQPLTSNAELRIQLLNEYHREALPAAKGFNQKQVYIEDDEGRDWWADAGRT